MANANLRSDAVTSLNSFISKQEKLLSELTENAIKSKLLAEDLEKYDLSEEVREMEEATLQSISLSKKIENFSSALQTVMKNYTFKESPTDFDELLKGEIQLLEANSEFNPENHELYLDFKQAVWNVHNVGVPMPGHEDDELIMTVKLPAKSNLQCPLTLKQIVDLQNPVCGVDCRHVYDKEAILKYIRDLEKNKKRNNNKIVSGNCPIPGCKKILTVDTIVFDTKLKMELMELRAKLQENNTNNSITSIE